MTIAKAANLATPAHRLAALVFTDIVNSTQYKSRLRSAYLPLLERHNELIETGVRESPSGEIIKHTGDGYFAAFATATDAVHFALLFQARMKVEPWQPEKIETRLGIHIGEVVFMDMAGRKDIVGLSADIAARLMSLAVGGQILLTDTAFNDARQYVNSSPAILGKAPPLRWMAHGRYLFKGADEPLEVYEVGIENAFPLRRPTDSEKVKRVVPHDQESTLGWRPAMSLPVPGRAGWQLVRKLGEGGFGEVWLGEHQKLKELRVFKFCFDTDRLRGLKREYMLFRLLREGLGRRPDIAALYEVKLDEPPFFLESEYSEGGNLLEWAERRGGIQTLDLKARIEVLAKVADALAAAHSVGILHKDIKPSNILIHESPDGTINPRLADFGIGAISDRSRLKAHNVTEAGFTDMDSATSSNSLGTRMYAPPESMRDTLFTMRGDIYALGVMLYQMVVGDLLRPLAPGWERDINDPILRQDIAAVVEGDPERRIASASEVARLLRSQDARREELRKAEAAQLARQRRRKMRRLASAAGIVGLVFLGLAMLDQARNVRKLDAERLQTERARDRAVAASNALAIQQARTQVATQFLLNVIKQADPANAPNGNPTAETLIQNASKQLDTAFADDSDVSADLQMCFADALRNFGDAQAVDHYANAARIYQKLYGQTDRRTLAALAGQGYALIRANQYAQGQALLKDVLDKQTKALDANDRDTLFTELLYAATIYNLSGPAAAEPLFKDAMDRRRALFREDDKDTIQSVSAYAMVNRDLGKLPEAEKMAKEALDWRSAHFGADGFSTLPSLQNYGAILIDLGRAAEGAPMLKTVMDRRLQLDPNKTKGDTLRAMAAYADALAAQGKYPDAEPLYQQAIHGLGARDEAAHRKQKETMAAQCGYAELLTATGRAVQAEPLAKEAYDLFNASAAAGPRLTLRAEFAWAEAMDKLGKPQAGGQYKDALDRATQAFGADSPITRQYLAGYNAFLDPKNASDRVEK